jgi:RibD C-terminal domain
LVSPARRGGLWRRARRARGGIAWGRADIRGDPIVTVLTERVPDAHLAGLRKDGVSYIFAGERQVDLGLALDVLNQELGIKRLLLEGGGNANGSFLRAGLIGEISLAIFPAVDGTKGAPCVFYSWTRGRGRSSGPRDDAQKQRGLEGGVVWLRYRLQSNRGAN